MTTRNQVPLFVSVFLFSLLFSALATTSRANAETTFSNRDVIRLVKLELGDEVVIAKIKQATDVAFDLTTDGLVQLKQAGIGARVIAAMLQKTTVPDATSIATNTGGSQPQFSEGRDDVRVVTDDKEVRLPANRGDLSTTGFWPVIFTFLDYPGLHARTRSKTVRPTLIIHSEHDPKGYYYLGKLDVNSEETTTAHSRSNKRPTVFPQRRESFQRDDGVSSTNQP